MKIWKIILGIIGVLIGLSALLWATMQADTGTNYPITTYVIGCIGVLLGCGSLICVIGFLLEDK